ncbi:MAG: hypothetical protein ABR927_02500 [Bacteroidales bacterium]|jgi:hypothetical protein
MWNPISIDKYVKIHLKKNPNENEKVLRVRIEAALDDYKNGIKCKCGKDIWVVGSASSQFGCFSCITGRDYPRGDYEIESALDKRDKYGRRHINEMDPRKINGMFDDDGYEIKPDSIKKPYLCLTCLKNIDPDWEEELLCNLNRNDQKNDNEFICYEFEKL